MKQHGTNEKFRVPRHGRICMNILHLGYLEKYLDALPLRSAASVCGNARQTCGIFRRRPWPCDADIASRRVYTVEEPGPSAVGSRAGERRIHSCPCSLAPSIAWWTLALPWRRWTATFQFRYDITMWDSFHYHRWERWGECAEWHALLWRRSRGHSDTTSGCEINLIPMVRKIELSYEDAKVDVRSDTQRSDQEWAHPRDNESGARLPKRSPRDDLQRHLKTQLFTWLTLFTCTAYSYTCWRVDCIDIA